MRRTSKSKKGTTKFARKKRPLGQIPKNIDGDDDDNSKRAHRVPKVAVLQRVFDFFDEDFQIL